MSWTLGIGVNNKSLVAKILSDEGVAFYQPLSQLISNGIPTPVQITRKVDIDTSFASWQKVESHEYTNAYGLKVPLGAKSMHSIFEFKFRKTRILVPALVLIRALFIPNKALLRVSFQAQFLESIGFIGKSGLNIDSPWHKPGYRLMSANIENALRWMFSFPSAYRMAHSVHEAAIRGRIDLKLPKAKARVNVEGLKIKNTYYASKLSISKITAEELPFDDIKEISPLVHYLGAPQGTNKTYVIPTNENGDIQITDSEWQHLEPLLLAEPNGRKYKLSQRGIFNGIISKLHFNTPWRKTCYQTGTFIHASRAYQFWKKRGTFDVALELLRQLRQQK